MALGRTQVGAYFGLYQATPQLENPVDRTDPVGAPPPFSCTANPPWRVEVGGQWSQPVLAADWPGQICPIDLATAIKAQIQEEDVCSTQEGHT